MFFNSVYTFLFFHDADLFCLIADVNGCADERKLGLLLHDCVQVSLYNFIIYHKKALSVFKIIFTYLDF